MILFGVVAVVAGVIAVLADQLLRAVAVAIVLMSLLSVAAGYVTLVGAKAAEPVADEIAEALDIDRGDIEVSGNSLSGRAWFRFHDEELRCGTPMAKGKKQVTTSQCTFTGDLDEYVPEATDAFVMDSDGKSGALTLSDRVLEISEA